MATWRTADRRTSRGCRRGRCRERGAGPGRRSRPRRRVGRCLDRRFPVLVLDGHGERGAVSSAARGAVCGGCVDSGATSRVRGGVVVVGAAGGERDDKRERYAEVGPAWRSNECVMEVHRRILAPRWRVCKACLITDERRPCHRTVTISTPRASVESAASWAAICPGLRQPMPPAPWSQRNDGRDAVDACRGPSRLPVRLGRLVRRRRRAAIRCS